MGFDVGAGRDPTEDRVPLAVVDGSPPDLAIEVVGDGRRAVGQDRGVKWWGTAVGLVAYGSATGA